MSMAVLPDSCSLLALPVISTASAACLRGPAATVCSCQCHMFLQAGRDALINAPTGSGKTLAYLAPLVHDLQVGIAAPEGHGSYAKGAAMLCCDPASSSV